KRPESFILLQYCSRISESSMSHIFMHVLKSGFVNGLGKHAFGWGMIGRGAGDKPQWLGLARQYPSKVPTPKPTIPPTTAPTGPPTAAPTSAPTSAPPPGPSKVPPGSIRLIGSFPAYVSRFVEPPLKRKASEEVQRPVTES